MQTIPGPPIALSHKHTHILPHLSPDTLYTYAFQVLDFSMALMVTLDATVCLFILLLSIKSQKRVTSVGNFCPFPTSIMISSTLRDVCARAQSLQQCPTVRPMDWRLAGSLSMGFSREEYWSGLPHTSLGDFPDPGTEPAPLASPALQADSLLLSHKGSPHNWIFKQHMWQRGIKYAGILSLISSLRFKSL